MSGQTMSKGSPPVLTAAALESHIISPQKVPDPTPSGTIPPRKPAINHVLSQRGSHAANWSNQNTSLTQPHSSIHPACHNSIHNSSSTKTSAKETVQISKLTAKGGAESNFTLAGFSPVDVSDINHSDNGSQDQRFFVRSPVMQNTSSQHDINNASVVRKSDMLGLGQPIAKPSLFQKNPQSMPSKNPRTPTQVNLAGDNVKSSIKDNTEFKLFIGDKDKLLSIQSWINNLQDGARSESSSVESASQINLGLVNDSVDSGYVSTPATQKGWPGEVKKSYIPSREIVAMELDECLLTDVGSAVDDVVQQGENMDIDEVLTQVWQEVSSQLSKECLGFKKSWETEDSSVVDAALKQAIMVAVDTNVLISNLDLLALALVEEETRRYRPTKNYLEYMPPAHYNLFETEIMKTEFERLQSRIPMDMMNMKRYELPQPPAGKMTDVSAWNECVENSQAQLEHQALRLLNLELLQDYEGNAWKMYNDTLVIKMMEQAQKQLAELKLLNLELMQDCGGNGCDIDILVIKMMVQAQKQLAELKKKIQEINWQSLVGKNYEIEQACVEMEKELAELEKQKKTKR